MRTGDRGSSDLRLEVCKLDIVANAKRFSYTRFFTAPRFQDFKIDIANDRHRLEAETETLPHHGT